MKKIALALLIVLALALPSYAKFHSKGYIPGADGLKYRGLSVSEKNGAKVTLVNTSNGDVKFSAALSFMKGREPAAEIFIKDVRIEAEGELALEGLVVTGDAKAAKRADTINWTVYIFEPL